MKTQRRILKNIIAISSAALLIASLFFDPPAEDVLRLTGLVLLFVHTAIRIFNA